MCSCIGMHQGHTPVQDYCEQTAHLGGCSLTKSLLQVALHSSQLPPQALCRLTLVSELPQSCLHPPHTPLFVMGKQSVLPLDDLMGTKTAGCTLGLCAHGGPLAAGGHEWECAQ